jgi:hypothetical protein
MQMVLTREMIGPDRRLALLRWENGSGTNDLYFDGSCKGCVASPALTETAQCSFYSYYRPQYGGYSNCTLPYVPLTSKHLIWVDALGKTSHLSGPNKLSSSKVRAGKRSDTVLDRGENGGGLYGRCCTLRDACRHACKPTLCAVYKECPCMCMLRA